jgi:phasin
MANTETKTNRTVKSAARAAEQAAETTSNAGEKIAANAANAARDMADAAFGYAKFEVPEMFRSFSEQTLGQTREAYARMKAVAEEATDVLEESFESTREGVREAQFKTLDAAQANAEATFELARKLLTVTSVADALQLQTAFARERFEAFVDFSKDVQTTLSKVSAEAVKPGKTLFERTLAQAKAA